MGIIGILAGLFLIQALLQGALILSSTHIILIGLAGMAYGIIGLVHAIRGGSWSAALISVVSILLSMYLLSHVWFAALALPWLFGIFAIAGGIAAISLAFRLK